MQFARGVQGSNSIEGYDAKLDDAVAIEVGEPALDTTCRTRRISFEKLKSGRLFGYLARRPGNRATTARCPRGRAGTHGVQVVGARPWYRRDGE